MSLITFSGIDCCGKSTQIELLKAELQVRGRSFRSMWLRVGYTPGFSAIKSFLRTLVGRKIVPVGHTRQREAFMRRGWKRRVWLYLAITDLFWQTSIRVRWHEVLGRVVICDRYLVDSEFDLAMNFGDEDVRQWWTWRLMRSLAARPETAFLIDISFQESLRRSIEKREPFPEDDGRRLRRSSMYDAEMSRGNWHVIDGTRPIAEVRSEILELVLGHRVCVPAMARESR